MSSDFRGMRIGSLPGSEAERGPAPTLAWGRPAARGALPVRSDPAPHDRDCL